ncbi:SDR family NAD(P)-dependent oxidoreductase [Pendulispora rubella]|uniref:SDR family NAD(P)-dependent oxidoreductase n=1 Tax=Pendulispora rubella TaxID=2741070 RepID=A0ABZ2LIH1_9BACT
MSAGIEKEPAPRATALADQTQATVSKEPIAIVGMACRFPGRVDSPEQFWALLWEGVDTIRETPPERWDLEAHYDPDPQAAGKVSTRWGGFLERIDGFEPSFFGISPREAMQMDPQQRLMLELAWEALEDAGVRAEGLAGSRTGVFVGAMWSDYARLTSRDPVLIDSFSATGQDTSIIAARISYVLGLEGPSLVVNTACSSSLVAVHLACQSLRSGECDVALAGGVHVMASVSSTVAMSKFGAMGASGRCRSFDERADGYVRGEGGGMVTLKPLSRALRDGDRIYCLVRGCAINNDGFSNGLTAPSPKAQQAVLRQAYANANVAPEAVHYVETHGPGTSLGDPIEAGALGAVLGAGRPAERPLRLGSVKTNLGHLEAAAGIAGLIKTALSIHRRFIPKNLHFEEPNHLIAFEALRLDVQRERTAWPSPDTAIAGVSSFGFGGTNAHVVLEGLPARPRLLDVGADNAHLLSRRLLEILGALSGMQDDSELDGLCRRAGRDSVGAPRRTAFVARSPDEMFDAVAGAIKLGRGIRSVAERSRAVFVFPGQGSQWLGMGRTLLRTEPAFRAAMVACDRAVRERAGWSVLDELVADASRSRLEDVRVVQVLLFAVQIALAALWRSWGVVPDAVVGHSMGEIAAAHVAGILDLEDAVRIVCARSELVRTLASGQGTMALVGLSADEAARAIAGQSGKLTIAAHNGPHAVVLSGNPDAMEALIRPLEEAGVHVGRVKVDYASHSPQMDALRGPLLDALRGIAPKRREVRFVSTVRSESLQGPECTPEYWFENLRAPVHLHRAIETLLAEGPTVFLEVSAHPILEKALQSMAAKRGGTVLHSMRRDEAEDGVFFETLRTLSTHGVPLRWEGLAPSTVTLPLSAKSREALRDLAKTYRLWLSKPGRTEPLADVAYTAAVRRSHHAHRLVVRGRGHAELVEALEAVEAGRVSPNVFEGADPERAAVVFVFPGQGSQWVGMGRELLAREPVFRRAILECEAALGPHVDWSLLAQLEAAPEASRLGEVDVVQPTIFAIQVALARLWQSWGIEPAAVVGHSMGEVAAAHVAGVLGLDDAARIIAVRSRITRRHASGKGAMAVVELSFEEAEAAIAVVSDRLAVGVSNGPRSSVLSGEPAALDTVLAVLERRGVFCRRVKVDYASHSPQMDPLRPRLLEALAGLAPVRARVPFYSTVTGDWLDGDAMDASYWAANLREPVRFADAVRALRGSGHGVFLEISPNPVLVPVIEDGLRHLGVSGAAIPSLRRDEPEREGLLRGLAQLFVRGATPDWAKVHPDGGQVVSLPSYPWQRESYWLEDAPVESPRSLRPKSGEHPLLGPSIPSSVHPGTRFWDGEIHLAALPYLRDHKVEDAVVLPATAYVEMALAAAQQAFGGDGVHGIEDLSFREALVLREQPKAHRVQLVLSEHAAGGASFRIASVADGKGAWTLHASGSLRTVEGATLPEDVSLDAIRTRAAHGMAPEAHYQRLAGWGLKYGLGFRAVIELWRGTGEALGRIRLPASVARRADAYALHPVVLDAALHVLLGLVTEGEGRGPFVPVHVRAARLHRPTGAEVFAHARLHTTEGQGAIEGDVVLLDASGQVLAEVLGVQLQRLERVAPPMAEEQQPFVSLTWKRTDAVAGSTPRGRWLLLANEGSTGEALCRNLEALGETVLHVRPDAIDMDSRASIATLLATAFDGQAPCCGVIQALGVEATHAVETADAAVIEEDAFRACTRTLHLVQALTRMPWRHAPRLWLVTRGAQQVGPTRHAPAVAQAALWGLGRTIGYEHPDLRCTLVDLDPSASDEEPELLAREFVANGPEDQIGFRPDGRYAARLVKGPPSAPTDEALTPAGTRPFRLEIDQPGVLDRLALRAIPPAAPAPGEVTLEVTAAGLNFLDVLLALGAVPEDEENQDAAARGLGAECAGRIVAVGDGVDHLRVGDDVLAVAPGAIGTHVVTSAHLVVPRPAHIDADDAATLPIVHLTAYYALAHVARLTKGERVLIHSAAGGVGLAAIQWARHVGAEIYATAGSAEKRTYLRSLGVKHVSDSRSLHFASDIREWTQGEGVDVVLNSLAGDFIPKSLELLRDHGRFVELGKRDPLSNGQLGLRPFLRNLSFTLVDLRGMWRKRPEAVGRVLREVLSWVERGVLSPLPKRAFPIGEAAEAFREMSHGRHIGKIVLSTRDARETRIAAPSVRARIRPEGSYLVTGGLGGLGLSVAQWMVAQGARHLLLVGRSGVSLPEQQDALDALRASGATVAVGLADVSDRAALAHVLADYEGPSFRGVVHAAGLLEDGLLAQQEPERFRAVMKPKIAGALHLDALTRDEPLDFFVLYSSIAGLLGSPGQGNYAAANAFLDALAHNRRARNLVGCSVGWGPFSDVGLAAADAKRGVRLAQRGMGSLTSREGIGLLERALARGDVHVGAVPFDVRQWVEFYPAIASSSMFSDLRDEGPPPSSAPSSELRRAVSAAAPEQHKEIIEQFVRDQVGLVLRMEPGRVARSTPLKSLGIDSLLGLELRNRLEAGVETRLPSTLIWTFPHVAALTEHFAGLLAPSAEVVSGGEDLTENDEALHDDVRELSNEGLIAALSSELAQVAEEGGE